MPAGADGGVGDTDKPATASNLSDASRYFGNQPTMGK
jgi:hypothetical protein